MLRELGKVGLVVALGTAFLAALALAIRCFGIPEWLLAIMVGAVGGLVNVYLTTGGVLPLATTVPMVDSPHPVSGKPRAASADRFIAPVVRLGDDPGIIGYIGVGAVAGFVYWGLGTENASFGDYDLTVKPIIGALLAGIAGGRLLRSHADNESWQTGMAKLGGVVERLADATERDAHDDEPGGEDEADRT